MDRQARRLINKREKDDRFEMLSLSMKRGSRMDGEMAEQIIRYRGTAQLRSDI